MFVAVAALAAACDSRDVSLNGPTHPSFATATGAPAEVLDLAVASASDTSVTLSFTEVDDGIGAPSSYDIRFMPSPMSWGGAALSVSRGTCAAPLAGTAIGARRICTVLGLTTGTAYDFRLVPFRGTLKVNAVFGALSNVASDTARARAATAPRTASDLRITAVTDTSATLSFTEVNDGTGQPASYDVRYVVGATMSWGGNSSVVRGTCATPLAGTTIGVVRRCTVLGLSGSTAYSFQLVAFRGTLRVNAVFGGLSNVTSGTTAPGGQVPVASVTVTPASVALAVGGTQQLGATLRDASGNALTGRAVNWTSSNAAVATVSANGLAQAVGEGSAILTATSGAVSGTVAVTVATPAVTSPGTVSDLTVAGMTDTSLTLSFTEVKDGTGKAARYDVRLVVGATLSWGGTPSVVRGTCATPMMGTAIGAKRTCTVLGVSAATTYSFQLVAFRGTLKTNAVFGGLSNATSGATAGRGGSGAGQVTYYRTNFTDGTTGPLDVYAYGGGSCGPSTDYRDAGSAASIKCTIPAIDYGAAALQAWFGHGRLSGLPSDPSLGQDLFQEVRFVLAPGAAGAIGGTACTVLNPSSQFKVHKSVYGQAGSAVNGWVMSAIGPCSDGGRLGTEAEMWNIDGRTYPWSSASALLEGSVYDVIYRYHRYTAQGCGTIAVWVNGTKVWDSPCQSYLGTTNGSTQGLLFWDGATYLQSGLTALTVYTLFTQATNYPIGAATASP